MRRLLARAILAALVALLAAACASVTRVAYDNAPFAAAWLVDDWFDLHDGQRGWVKERLASLHDWHRSSELPAYERLLAQTAARAARGLTAEDARQVHREMRALWLRLVRRAIPDMADFLAQLHPEQVVFLARKFDEDNERAVRESVRGTPQERLERRQKRYLERIEDWTGRLSAPQRDLVRARVAAMGDLTDEWLGDRRFRQSETIALLRSRPSRAQLEAGLTRLLVESGSWRRPEYVAKMKARDEQVFAMVAELDATLTAEQRGRLHRRLAAYAADAAHLAAAN